MPEEKKPKCPECSVEIVLVDGKMPEKCEKCSFPLKGFAGFGRWFRAAAREYEQEQADARKRAKKTTDDNDSPLSALADL